VQRTAIMKTLLAVTLFSNAEFTSPLNLHGNYIVLFCSNFFNNIARTSACNQQYLSNTNILISILCREREEQRWDGKAGLKNIFLAYSSVNHFILAEKAARIAVSVTINDKYLIKCPYHRHRGCFGYGLVRDVLE